MRWPQVVIIVLMGLDILFTMLLHGEPKEGKYDVGVTLISNLIYAMILYAGGFWDV